MRKTEETTAGRSSRSISPLSPLSRNDTQNQANEAVRQRNLSTRASIRPRPASSSSSLSVTHPPVHTAHANTHTREDPVEERMRGGRGRGQDEEIDTDRMDDSMMTSSGVAWGLSRGDLHGSSSGLGAGTSSSSTRRVYDETKSDALRSASEARPFHLTMDWKALEKDARTHGYAAQDSLRVLCEKYVSALDGTSSKVVVLGNAFVGKTSLLMRIMKDKFKDAYRATVAVDFVVRHFVLDNGISYQLSIWDTAGQERLQAFTTQYYRGCVAAILCFAVDDESSFRSLPAWLHRLRTEVDLDAVHVFLVGCKGDKDRIITERDAKEFAQENKIRWGGIVSAKSGGEDIQNLIDTIARVCFSHELYAFEKASRGLSPSFPLSSSSKVGHRPYGSLRPGESLELNSREEPTKKCKCIVL